VANVFFTAFRNNLWQAAAPNLSSATVKAMFVDGADDTPTAADDFIDDIASAGRVPAIASCPALASKTFGTVAAGIFDAADTTFASLTGDQSEYLILFEDSGTEATSDLLILWDTATGLPLTPNGADVVVQWNASGIGAI
jgi:hypothetical protein